MTHWLIVFAILTADGQIIRKNPTVEFPTLATCEAQGKQVFQDFRGKDWWAFFDCRKE